MSAKDTKGTWDRILWRLQGEGKHSIALRIGELFCSMLYNENPFETQLNAMLQIGYNCKGNLTTLRRILHLDLAKGNPK
jgi:hypothetical protein